VTLYDGSGTDGGALYVDVISGLVLSGGTVINIAGATEVLNIYYNPLLPENAYLGTMTYAFASGNGQLIPTPLPGSVLLLGSGLLGLGLPGLAPEKAALRKSHLLEKTKAGPQAALPFFRDPFPPPVAPRGLPSSPKPLSFPALRAQAKHLGTNPVGASIPSRENFL